MLQASCEPKLPEKIFETDEEEKPSEKMTAQQLEDEEVEREEGEDDGEGLEGRKIGDGEEREDVADKEMASTSVKGSGLGLGSLLQVSENSTQNHGSITLHLDVPWSSQLSPLPHESPPPLLTSWANSQAPTDPTSPPLSLDIYLQLCEKHLSMGEADLQFNRAVYITIDQRGDRGMGGEELRGALPPLPPSPNSHLTFDDHLQCLLNFEMVYTVHNWSPFHVIFCLHSRL